MPKVKKEFDQVKYQNEFNKTKYDRVNLMMPRGQKAVVKEKATEAGQSVNEYINQAIKERIDTE